MVRNNTGNDYEKASLLEKQNIGDIDLKTKLQWALS